MNEISRNKTTKKSIAGLEKQTCRESIKKMHKLISMIFVIVKPPREYVETLAHAYETSLILKSPRYVSSSDDIKDSSLIETSLSYRDG